MVGHSQICLTFRHLEQLSLIDNGALESKCQKMTPSQLCAQAKGRSKLQLKYESL